MRAKVAILAICMLLTGSLNTIATKLQDNVVVRHDAAGQPVRFRHPAFQTAAMFLGEALCLVPFALRRWWKAAKRAGQQSEEEAAARSQQLRRSFWVFSLPAMCDAAASTLLNLGLFYTYASVFQMLRGMLAVFAGLLTIVLLHRRLHSHHWLGMVLICAGAALVGASSIIYDRTDPKRRARQAAEGLAGLAAGLAGASDPGGNAQGGGGGALAAGLRRLLMLEGLGGSGAGGIAPNPLLGNVLVVTAQLLAATQFIVEEKYLVKYRAPVLMAVGMEGFWGLVLSCVALPALQFVRGPDGQPLDSFSAALAEVRGNATLQWTTAATVISIAFFNFFGVSVTKNLSGAARATIDACRTLFIWLFALRLGWERFHMLQVVGFLVLLSGTSVYNEILRSCLPAAEPRRRRHAHHRLSRGEALAGDAEAGLQQPLLLGDEELAGGGGQAGGSGGQEAAGGKSHTTVRFAADTPASRPIAAGRQGDGPHARYTMARSVTILPAALSPHSLASVPSISFGDASFTFSVPRNLSSGSGLGGRPVRLGDEEDEDETTGGAFGSESEVSESEAADSRDVSQHGPGGTGGWSPAHPPPPRGQ
ncbi:hypothetical protein ABPG75_012862 [Micractinium tetrahymenae]